MDPMPEGTPGGVDLGYRALVVDDEAALADVVATYLQREHFEVTVCHNGAEALAVARGVDPDVVVLDLGLPGIDGFEVCRQLRTFSDASVVMLTARDAEMDTIVGLTVGADDYITKPFSPRELVARIRAMLRRPRFPTSVTAPTGTGDQIPPPRHFGPLAIDIGRRFPGQADRSEVSHRSRPRHHRRFRRCVAAVPRCRASPGSITDEHHPFR